MEKKCQQILKKQKIRWGVGIVIVLIIIIFIISRVFFTHKLNNSDATDVSAIAQIPIRVEVVKTSPFQKV